jgi:two-component system sensor histidine kinase/response regulator
MIDYLSKPIDPGLLWKTLHQWLVPDAELPDAATLHEPQDPAGPFSDWSIEGLDTATGLRLMGGKQTLYLDMLRKFVLKQADVAERIRNALVAGDPAAAERIVHTLKGLCGSIGAQALQQLAGTLESVLRSGGPDQALQAPLADLEDDIADLVDKLKARLPAERVDEAAAQPDMSQLSAAVDRLGEMLSDADAESLDFFHRHQVLFKAAWPESYGSIRDAVESFDFELALVEMRDAMDRRNGKVAP